MSPFKSAGATVQSTGSSYGVRGSAGSDCIICSKYVDHSMQLSLPCVKEQVKRSGEREIAYMCTNS
jgi:hypothetical protein